MVRLLVCLQVVCPSPVISKRSSCDSSQKDCADESRLVMGALNGGEGTHGRGLDRLARRRRAKTCSDLVAFGGTMVEWRC